jgi:hypothetical protein
MIYHKPKPARRDKMPKFEPLIEYFVGKRRYHHCYCTVCHTYLGSTGPGEAKQPTREEYGDLICSKCREKAETPKNTV